MKDYFEIDVYVEKISGAALLCDNAGKKGWVPKSLIENYNEDFFAEGLNYLIAVESWFLEKEGWI